MNLQTIGQVAEHFSVPVHRVRYAVKSRGIGFVAKAGTYRLFGPKQIRQIELALAETERKDEDDGDSNGEIRRSDRTAGLPSDQCEHGVQGSDGQGSRDGDGQDLQRTPGSGDHGRQVDNRRDAASFLDAAW